MIGGATFIRNRRFVAINAAGSFDNCVVSLNEMQPLVCIAWLAMASVQDVVSAAPVQTFNELEAALVADSVNIGPVEITTPSVAFEHEILVNTSGGIEVQSATGTILDGGQKTRHFYITMGSAMTLRNMALVNGVAAVGGAIYVDVGGELTLIGCNASWNVATSRDEGHGGVIYMLGALLVINGGIFGHNMAEETGGFVCALSPAVVLVRDAKIVSNIADDAGAIYWYESADAIGALTIDGVAFEGNVASRRGGDISTGWAWNAGSSIVIVNSSFTNSSADSDGGSIFSWLDLLVFGSTFDHCTSEDGGAIACFARLTLISVNATNNYAVENGGCLFTRDDVTMIDCTFRQNSAFETGGAWEHRNGVAWATGIQGIGNTAPYGGFVCVDSDEFRLSVTNSSLSNNHAIEKGGVVYNSEPNFNSLVQLTGTYAANNTASRGAIYCGGGRLELASNFEAHGNVASVNGGVANVFHDAIIEGSRTTTKLHNNVAVSGAAFFIESSVVASIRGLQIERHFSNLGAIHIAPDAEGTVSLVDSSANVAVNAGAVYYCDIYSRALIVNVISMYDMSYSAGGVAFFDQGADVELVKVRAEFSMSLHGAVRSNEAAFVSIRDSVFVSCNASLQGGAVSAKDTPLIIVNTNFVSNAAASHGGAVALEGGSTLFANVLADSNVALRGSGGAVFVAAGAISFHDSTLRNSKSQTDGGAVSIIDGTYVTCDNSTFEGSAANRCGGAFALASSTVVLAHSTVAHNRAVLHGGGLALFEGSEITSAGNNSFLFNSATSGNGGVFNIDATSNMLLNQSDRALGNQALHGGGGVAFVKAVAATTSIFLPIDNDATSNMTENAALYGPIVASNVISTVVSHDGGPEASGNSLQAPIVVAAIDSFGQIVASLEAPNLARLTVDLDYQIRGSAELIFKHGQASTIEGTEILAAPGANTTVRAAVQLINNPVEVLASSIVIPLRACRIGEVLAEGGSRCRMCAGPDEVSFNPGAMACDNCPHNCKCSPTASTAPENAGRVLRPNRGYWRSGPYSRNIRYCVWKSSCAGGIDLFDKPTSCVKKHAGVLCALCVPNHILNRKTGRCRECVSSARIREARIKAVVVLLSLLMTIVVATALFERCNSPKLRQIQDRFRRTWRSCVRSFGSKFKLWIVMLQILVSYRTNFRFVRFPKAFESFSIILALFINVDIYRLVPYLCFKTNHFDEVLFVTILPAAAACVAYGTRLSVLRLSQKVKKGATFATFVFLFLWYPYASTTILQTFRCDDKFRRDSGEPTNSAYRGHVYLESDYSIRCTWRSYKRFRVYAIASIAGVIVGIPLIFFLVLWRLRERINPPNVDRLVSSIERGLTFSMRSCFDADSDRFANLRLKARAYRDIRRAVDVLAPSTKLKVAPALQRIANEIVMEHNVLDPGCSHLRFLYIDYNPQYYYFESVDLIRRLVLTAVVPAMYSRSEDVGKLYTLCLLSLVFTALYIAHRPYANVEVAVFAIVMNAILSLTFFFGIVLFAEDNLDADSRGGWDRRILGAMLVFLAGLLPPLLFAITLHRELNIKMGKDYFSPIMNKICVKVSTPATTIKQDDLAVCATPSDNGASQGNKTGPWWDNTPDNCSDDEHDVPIITTPEENDNDDPST